MYCRGAERKDEDHRWTWRYLNPVFYCRPMSTNHSCHAALHLPWLMTMLQSGTLKTRDWKTQDLKSMESVTIFKSKSYGAEIKTVYGGMVAMLKSSVHQGMAASALSVEGRNYATNCFWVGIRCYKVTLQRKRQRDTVFLEFYWGYWAVVRCL